MSVGGSRNASLRALALSTRHRLDLALSRAGKFSVLKHGILALKQSLKHLYTTPCLMIQCQYWRRPLYKYLLGGVKMWCVHWHCNLTVLRPGEVGAWPVLQGHGLFWAAVHVSLMIKWYLQGYWAVFCLQGEECSLPGKICWFANSQKKYFCFQLFTPTKSFNFWKDKFEKKIEARVNQVSGRIHPPWLHIVVKQKILPCTDLRPAVKITSYSCTVL